MNLHQLQYGLIDGKLVHVTDVARGAACDCACPSCGLPLIAKKGEKKQHHFAHANGADCPTACETALHLAAKEIIERRKAIVLPRIAVSFSSYREHLELSPEKLYQIEHVELEKRVGEIIPDVLVTINGRKLAIEIKVTHAVDSRKLERFRELGLSAIEIDLSDAPRELPLNEIETFVIEGGKHKSWVYNVAVEKKRTDMISRAHRFKTIHRGLASHVDGCPLSVRTWKGKSYANVVDNCLNCRHAVDIGENMSSVACDAALKSGRPISSKTPRQP